MKRIKLKINSKQYDDVASIDSGAIPLARVVSYGRSLDDGVFVDGYVNLELSMRQQKETKPTRTEYEKVTESIFDLRESLESGELYERVVSQIRSVSITEGSGVIYEYEQIKSELDLFKLAVNGDVIHRKVEKEIDERQEFVCLAISMIDHTNSDDPSYYSGWFEQLYDAGCRFVGANEEID